MKPFAHKTVREMNASERLRHREYESVNLLIDAEQQLSAVLGIR